MDVYLPIITLVLGATLTWLAEERRESRAVEREKAVRQETAETERRARVGLFQGETLVAVQDALWGLTNATAGVAEYDHEYARGMGSWPEKGWTDPAVGSAPPPVLTFYERMRRVSYARVRVENDDLRVRIQDVQGRAVNVVNADGEEESKRLFGEMDQASTEVNEILGALLRETY